MYTTHNSDRATSLDGNCTYHVGKVQSIFISGQLKVFLLFHILLTPHVYAVVKYLIQQVRCMDQSLQGAREYVHVPIYLLVNNSISVIMSL